jgi:hypothetical protein
MELFIDMKAKSSGVSTYTMKSVSRKLCTVPTQSIYLFRVTLRVISDYIRAQHNTLVDVMEPRVSCEVRTEPLYIILETSRLQRFEFSC